MNQLLLKFDHNEPVLISTIVSMNIDIGGIVTDVIFDEEKTNNLMKSMITKIQYDNVEFEPIYHHHEILESDFKNIKIKIFMNLKILENPCKYRFDIMTTINDKCYLDSLHCTLKDCVEDCTKFTKEKNKMLYENEDEIKCIQIQVTYNGKLYKQYAIGSLLNDKFNYKEFNELYDKYKEKTPYDKYKEKTPYDLWVESYKNAGQHQKLSAFLREYYDDVDELILSNSRNIEFKEASYLNTFKKKLECENLLELYILRENKMKYISKLKLNQIDHYKNNRELTKEYIKNNHIEIL